MYGCVYVCVGVYCAMLKFRLQKQRGRGYATKGADDVASRLLTIIMRLKRKERERDGEREGKRGEVLVLGQARPESCIFRLFPFQFGLLVVAVVVVVTKQKIAAC